jgi:putative ABC transport system permease protein
VVRGTASLASIEIGFDTENLWALRLQIPQDDRGPDEIAALTRALRTAVATVPGVDRADLWSPHTPGAATWSTKVRSLEQAAVPEDQLPSVRINTTSPGAATGIGLQLVAGRDLTEDDLTSGRRVVLVSESYARATWPDGDVVGRQLRRWSHAEWSTVVGVVADAPLSGRARAESDSFRDVYFLLGQDPQRDWVLLARADDDPAVIDAIRAAVARAAPDTPMFDGELMSDVTGRELLLPRFVAWLGAAYATMAGLLAAVGLYAVIAYSVTLQRSSIGIRMALGASRAAVRSDFTRRGMRLALLGLAIGLGIAALTTRLLAAQLYGVSPVDLTSYAAVALGVTMAALLSSLVPAQRAARVDPLVALKH